MKGPGDQMLVIFNRFNIPLQVWNAYALSDATQRKNFEPQVISNPSYKVDPSTQLHLQPLRTSKQSSLWTPSWATPKKRFSSLHLSCTVQKPCISIRSGFCMQNISSRYLMIVL